ncbi:2028_t:CDS:2 [Diversispora eburnea]|uniref:Restriction of telomere capping protein 5 n=1 Tax=Diversispora eburnea TaxID=1213867 RepID=A0A9N9EZ68_9GLOM|nr:2028_t:CDS:2 [Diversispora eburnea]
MGQFHSNSSNNGHKNKPNNNMFGRNYSINNSINNSDRIALGLERKNFTYIESFSLQSTFETLCKIDENGVGYINEESFMSYIGFPESIGIGPIIYRSFTYLASYPTCIHDNRRLLNYNGLLIAISVYCNKIKEVINEDRIKLLFDSFTTSTHQVKEKEPPNASSSLKFDPDNDEDFLKLMTQAENESKKNVSKVTCQDMLSILTGLIWLMTSEMIIFSNLKPERLTLIMKELTSPKHINKVYKIASKIVESMARCDSNSRKLNSEEILKESISWPIFKEFVKRNTPNIFRGFSTFFYTQFCIGQTLSAQRSDTLFLGTNLSYLPTLDNPSELFNHINMTLLLWMLPEKIILNSEWNCLYSGSKHGFSMSRFSTYISNQWHSANSSKNCFGSEECFLFELYPTYEISPASKKNSNYVYYNSSVGIGFGGLATSGLTSSKIVGMEENSFVLQLDNTLQFGKYRMDPYRNLAPTYYLSMVKIEVVGTGGQISKEKLEREQRWEESEAAKRSKSLNLRRSSSSKVDKEILKRAGIIDIESRSRFERTKSSII